MKRATKQYYDLVLAQRTGLEQRPPQLALGILAGLLQYCKARNVHRASLDRAYRLDLKHGPSCTVDLHLCSAM